MFYDPMIAKVITKGRDRAEAIAHMGTALDAFRIRGVQHNIPFLAALVAQPRFVEGRLPTHFIEVEFPDRFLGLLSGRSSCGQRGCRSVVMSVGAVYVNK